MITEEQLDAIYDRIIAYQKKQEKTTSLDFVKEYIGLIQNARRM